MLVENPVHGEGFAKHIDLPRSQDIEIVVIVPTFRHSVFVADAVDSIVIQETERIVRVVIVDDGCPDVETRRIATVLATAYPDQVEYIRRTNGGLSAARNTGVEYALRRWPSVRALYFLDADNMIEPKALDRAFDTLMSDPSIGWVYPDIVMFGSSQEYIDYSGPYSILRHLGCNVSEAASMVRREVFDRGCRFDETMRQGFEDWEFWWQCIDAGFTGRHAPFFGLRYRKRPESMLSESEREKPGIVSYMRHKHKALFQAKFLLALEAREAPRYGILCNPGQIKICTDIRDKGASIGVEDAVLRLAAAHDDPYWHVAPRLLVAASEPSLEILARNRIDRFALWWLESQFTNGSGVYVAAIEIAAASSGQGIAIREMDAAYWPAKATGIHLMLMGQAELNLVLDDPLDHWTRTLLTDRPTPKTIILRIELSKELFSEIELPSVIYRWFDLFKQLHAARHRKTTAICSPKPRSIPPCSQIGALSSRLLESGPLLPLKVDNERNVAFVLPILAFGGVEKVAFHVAKQFHRNGWRCHLLVLAQQATIDESWLSLFDSIAFYEEESFYQWSDAQQYLGTTYPKWAMEGDARSLEGLLLTMDAVINFHSGALHKSIQKFRKLGVVTAVSLHLNDVSLHGRECGHPFLALGHEHVYDLVAPCSQTLLDWCHAMGVPRDKLVLVPNAPAHNIAADEITNLLVRRGAKNEFPHELNVLFLGRLDRQKGLDRVAAIIRRSWSLNLPIAWRIVGSTIVEGAEATLLRELDDLIEPAVYDPAELMKLYEWADVLLLPSYWEGLPLTIMEAAQLGVVPITSRVGAISEIVEHGKTGLLLDEATLDEFATTTVKALQALVEDHTLLALLSRQAAATMTRTWEAGCNELIRRIDAMVGARPKSGALTGVIIPKALSSDSSGIPDFGVF